MKGENSPDSLQRVGEDSVSGALAEPLLQWEAKS